MPLRSLCTLPQCDAAGAKILQRYSSVRQLARLLQSIHQDKGGAVLPEAATSSPREVSSAVNTPLHRQQKLARADPPCTYVSSSWPTYWCSTGGVQVEGYLEEMLLLAQRAEEYNQFMLAKMTEALAPAPLPAARHNDFRRVLNAVGRWPGVCIDSH